MAFEITLEITDREALLEGLRATQAAREARGDQQFIYTHGDSASGVCAICAPYGDMLTDGEGSNDVPVPPLHANCVCTLVPVELEDLSSDAPPAEPFSYLKSLNRTELSDILGEVRAQLVYGKQVTIDELYDEVGSLIPLKKLGYSSSGAKL